MFNSIITSLEGIVASSDWEDLPETFPMDWKGPINNTTFLKYGIILSTTESYYSTYSVPGLIKVSIYYPSTESNRYATVIADQLKSILSKSLFLSGKIQTKEPSLQFFGTDPDNTTLKRADFSIPFIYSGE